MCAAVLIVAGLLFQPAPGQSPTAVITGPKESRPGSLVVLDATESSGIGRLWLLAVSPEETSFLPVDGGLRCIFASPVPGDYTFVLIVSGTNPNGGPAAAMATHTVRLLGTVPPPVPPPDPPTPPVPPPGVNPYPTPAESWQQATAALRSIKLDRQDATALAKLYADAQRLVTSAPAAIAAGVKPEIGTTAQLRAWLIEHGRELGLQGRYAGLADAVDKYLGTQLGTEIRPVTGEDAAILGVLAWATWETGR